MAVWSRRGFLRHTGAAFGLPATAPAIAACGPSRTDAAGVSVGSAATPARGGVLWAAVAGRGPGEFRYAAMWAARTRARRVGAAAGVSGRG
ncbi:hypothetical protein ACFQE5_13605 [Pseudonocardia hispaniensis]|uniref:Twin-arginine translocation signal domain-containing protein n=1 Tax=Pseudonocardia hispaniensis TaxID=904933 RepID=A0ABW1J359_9PSEU